MFIRARETSRRRIIINGDPMRKCEMCGKGILRGNKVSHANNKTKTLWFPNIHKVHAIINGAAKRINACASCITSGKLVKA